MFFILRSLITEFFGCKEKIYFLKNIRKFNSLLIRAIYDAEFVFQKIKENRNIKFFYSVWLNDWALTLSVLKQKGIIKNFIVKCGGFDIYDERYPGNYLPFRYLIYKHAALISPNSKSGEVYLRSKNMFPSKIHCSYLGTHDHGINPFSNTNFNIVSCSRVIPLKRVELIIEILRHVKSNVKWVHFGDGPFLEQIRKDALGLPENIKVEFKGDMSNKQILDYYANNSVSLFITTSETEGLPISLQEAISFGIPVIGTDVGGISELVNEKTGFLIEKDFDPSAVSLLIENFIFGRSNSEEFRTGVRQYWKENFEDVKVYSEFCRQLDQYEN
ncbi:MAG TPA: glycosyltransferase [Bacteroidia bacterium]